MATLIVDVQHATAASVPPTDAQLTRWARAGWQQAHDSEVSLRLVDHDESAQLNGQYRDRPRPTNVLSFPFQAPAGITVPLAGDLVICAPVVAEEALQQGKTAEAHWAHMVIHGMLHLQGYDHIEDNEAEVMEALEIRLLAQLGYDNPYETEDTEPDS